MCWRAEGKTTGYRAALLGAAFLLSTAGGEGLGAQELPQEIVRLIETQAENGGGDPDGMVEYFTELLDRPIDLSMADMATLEACPLFTPFMTVSLLEYRREYGPVSSAAELALVDGFSPAVVELLQPFVTFGCVGSGGGQSRELKWYEKFSGKWTVRSKMDLERGGGFPDEGFPVPFYSRLRVDFEDRCSAGLTLENDRGERDFPDFCSFFISVQNLPLTKDGRFRLEAAVAGDFSLRFGQGLVLWNSFSMSGLSSPSAAVRRDGAVRPYTSSDENNYFHGAAMTFGFPGGVRASVFYSNNGADAAVEGEYFTTLPDDGLHDTDARRQGRNALREEVAGGNVSWRNSWIKAGVTAAAYRATTGSTAAALLITMSICVTMGGGAMPVRIFSSRSRECGSSERRLRISTEPSRSLAERCGRCPLRWRHRWCTGIILPSILRLMQGPTAGAMSIMSTVSRRLSGGPAAAAWQSRQVRNTRIFHGHGSG